MIDQSLLFTKVLKHVIFELNQIEFLFSKYDSTTYFSYFTRVKKLHDSLIFSSYLFDDEIYENRVFFIGQAFNFAPAAHYSSTEFNAFYAQIRFSIDCYIASCSTSGAFVSKYKQVDIFVGVSE